MYTAPWKNRKVVMLLIQEKVLILFYKFNLVEIYIIHFRNHVNVT